MDTNTASRKIQQDAVRDPRLRHRTAMRLIGILALTTAPVLFLAAPAQASTAVGRSGSTLVLRSSAGTSNDITLRRIGANLHITDPGDRLVAGPGCVGVTLHHVRCAVAGIRLIDVDVRDRNDKVRNMTPIASVIKGGPGNDTLSGGAGKDSLSGEAGLDTLSGGAGKDSLSGGAGADTLSGGAGNDSLSGDPGNDRLSGGAGRDRLSGGAGNDNLKGGAGNDTAFALAVGDGADRFSGGPGVDTANYGNRTVRVSVTLDGKADDGTGSEGDNNLTDVENALGGSGGDTLQGNAAGNKLTGGTGNDTLTGRRGPDLLEGGAGKDTLTGSSGDDELHGGAGDDRLTGSRGADLLRGEAGQDDIRGVDGVRGNDTVNGGANRDTCRSDPRDTKVNCER